MYSKLEVVLVVMRQPPLFVPQSSMGVQGLITKSAPLQSKLISAALTNAFVFLVAPIIIPFRDRRQSNTILITIIIRLICVPGPAETKEEGGRGHRWDVGNDPTQISGKSY